MFEVMYTENAEKIINKMPFDIGKRIYEKIQNASENPFHFFKKLESKDEFRLRVGKYRIVAQIDVARKIIFIMDIGNRENIYN